VTRIVICGGPRTGKTTFAATISDEAGDPTGITVGHTDDLIAQCAHLGKDAWSEASRLAGLWLDRPGPWIIEGVALARALRKWREAHLGEPPPIDRVIRLTESHVALTKGQAAMAKGEETVWREIESWILHAGVPVAFRAELRCEHPGHNGTFTLAEPGAGTFDPGNLRAVGGFSINTGRGPYRIAKVDDDDQPLVAPPIRADHDG
jgi:hypothetical protein